MLKAELISDAIMAGIKREVTAFLAKAIEQKPAGVALEREAREIGLKCGAQLLEQALQLYGEGHLGQTLPCHCPEALSSLRFIRYDRKTFITATGKVEARSAYYHCSGCGSSRWPAFERLGLGPGHLSEGARRIAAYAGAERGGFERAQVLVEKLSGIELSASTIERTCEQVGRQIQQQQQAEVEQAWKEASCPPQPSQAPQPVKQLHVATDGTTAPTQAGYREVKTAAIYELARRSGQPPRAEHVSYVSSFERAEAFGQEMWAEAMRRGAGKADRIVVLGDGAAWIWNLYALHFPQNRVEVLDFYHASEHLGAVAKACFGETSAKAKQWQAKQAATLLEPGGARRVLKALKRLRTSPEEAAQARSKHIGYFEANRGRMNYSEYLQQGYHIGSGLAESACKHLVGERLKQSGMTNWSQEGAEAVLRVRVVIANSTFDQYCDKAAVQRSQRAA
jgi:hypothetical protein